ncbi:hypothetical protein RJ639_022489 [Escallonia herrerae]|uniref:Uncharacterized protein n=1 Tax=Escallonia herrerae TaxID=1293975 RepID=A0AA88V525_9ASTE|nr:hypothetical protein RJ639_022489 [Escallonia herrerae]
MKPTIFNERVAKALHNWHQSAKKHIKQNRRHPASMTSLSSRPRTPLHGTSPVHLLHYYRSEIDSIFTSPGISSYHEKVVEGEPEGSASPSHNHDNTQWLHHNEHHDLAGEERDVLNRAPPNLLSAFSTRFASHLWTSHSTKDLKTQILQNPYDSNIALKKNLGEPVTDDQQGSAIQVKNVVYQNIKGTSASDVANWL